MLARKERVRVEERELASVERAVFDEALQTLELRHPLAFRALVRTADFTAFGHRAPGTMRDVARERGVTRARIGVLREQGWRRLFQLLGVETA